MPVDGDDESEAHGGFGGGDADGKDGEHDAAEGFGFRAVTPESDEVEVSRVEHEFDAHQNQDGVAASERAREADGKQERGEKEIAVERVHGFFRSCMAITTAPIMAAV